MAGPRLVEPPYSKIASFVAKLIDGMASGSVTEAIMLRPIPAIAPGSRKPPPGPRRSASRRGGSSLSRRMAASRPHRHQLVRRLSIAARTAIGSPRCSRRSANCRALPGQGRGRDGCATSIFWRALARVSPYLSKSRSTSGGQGQSGMTAASALARAKASAR